jgi:catechol 2,3-dioxygenase-like lactoylglutathione lyase family enzyme
VRRRISVISLGVGDLERSRRFYADGLGFEPRPESSDRAVFFQLEGTWLSLFPRERLAQLAGAEAQGSGFQGFVISHNVSTPAEVDSILKLALEAGATLAVPPEDGPFGRIGYFADPDGFRWEVAYTPKWPELSD